jgi:hypothetical protein
MVGKHVDDLCDLGLDACTALACFTLEMAAFHIGVLRHEGRLILNQRCHRFVEPIAADGKKP